MSDRYRFLRTTEHDGKVVALIGDQDVLGESGIDSLRRAFNAHAAPRIRQGVLMLTKEQLQERLHTLDNNNMPLSGDAFRRALVCIDQKTSPVQKQAVNVRQPKQRPN